VSRLTWIAENYKTQWQSNRDGFLKSLIKDTSRQIEEAFNGRISSSKKTHGTLHELSANLISEIRKIPAGHLLVFLMDDIGLPDVEVLEGLEERLLASLANCDNVMLIFAGRIPVHKWATFSLRPSKENIVNLPPFNYDKTVQQLEKQIAGTEHLTAEVLALSGGAPGYNYLIAEHATGEPKILVDKLDAVKKCNKTLLGPIPENIQPSLRALSVLFGFYDDDEMAPILHAYTDADWDRYRCRQLFNQMTDVRLGTGKLLNWDINDNIYKIEEQLRKMLELELRLSDEEMWKRLHCTAYEENKKLVDWYDSHFGENMMAYHAQKLQDAGFDVRECSEMQGGEK